MNRLLAIFSFSLLFFSCTQIIDLFSDTRTPINNPPEVTLTINNVKPVSGDLITATADAVDKDSDLLIFSWYLDGVLQVNENSSTFTFTKNVDVDTTFTISVDVSDKSATVTASKKIKILRKPYTKQEVRDLITISRVVVGRSYYYSSLTLSLLNTSNKTIKYLRVNATAYNAVDDIVHRSFSGRFTGPYAPDKLIYGEWDYAFKLVRQQK